MSEVKQAITLDQMSKEQLMETVEGLEMRVESLMTMINGLQRQNTKLAAMSQKNLIKAEAYKEMMYETLSQVQDHIEEIQDELPQV